MHKLVSIIVPCYNQGSYLGEALESVLHQTYPYWECIIINDGSTDETEAVAKQWCSKDSRFSYLYKTNGGLSCARNAGLALSKGEYIQFLDSDDLITKRKIEVQVSYLNEKINVGLVYCDCRYFNDKESPRQLFIYGRNYFYSFVRIDETDSIINYELIKERNFFVVSAPLLRKSVVDKIGLFDESLYALEDWDYWIRCSHFKVRFHCLPYSLETTTLIRLSAYSMMTNLSHMQEALIKLRIKHKFIDEPNKSGSKMTFKLLLSSKILSVIKLILRKK